MIRFTTRNNNEYFSSAFESLNEAIDFLSHLKDSDSFYVDDYFNKRANLLKKDILTVGLTAEDTYIDDGNVDRKILQIPTVDKMDINPDWSHINDDNLIKLNKKIQS
jgi:hypothetical protein